MKSFCYLEPKFKFLHPPTPSQNLEEDWFGNQKYHPKFKGGAADAKTFVNYVKGDWNISEKNKTQIRWANKIITRDKEKTLFAWCKTNQNRERKGQTELIKFVK